MSFKSLHIKNPANRDSTLLALAAAPSHIPTTPTPIPTESIGPDLPNTNYVNSDTIEYEYPNPPPINTELMPKSSQLKSSCPDLSLNQASLYQTQPPDLQPRRPEEDTWSESDYNRRTTRVPSVVTIWTPVMEEALCNELIQQVEQGKQADSGYKKEAWAAVIARVKEVSGRDVTLQQCKKKLDYLKARWTLFHWLKDQSGFRYNKETGLVEASFDVWAAIIQVSTTLASRALKISYGLIYSTYS